MTEAAVTSGSVTESLRRLIRRDVLRRFLRYVTIDTTSYSAVDEFPSSSGQLEFARQLSRELRELGLDRVQSDGYGYVYARFPGRGTTAALNLCAHLDTSEMENGRDVQPQCHVDYDGGAIRFPDAAELVLSPEDSPELVQCTGDTIITASGKTLLGADDKAGVAEIMTLVTVLQACPDWPCPELHLLFTPEEETGRGTRHLDPRQLAPAGFTLDIGHPGEINDACFDAWRVDIRIEGQSAHPGYARGRMRNAARVAAFIAAGLPLDERPETTDGDEGFYHLTQLQGAENNARLQIMLRDFDGALNQQRLAELHSLVASAEDIAPGIDINLQAVHMYPNMQHCTRRIAGLLDLAGRAFREVGVEPRRCPIRGGTDGALMCRDGIAMANLGTGGMLPHSRREWVALTAMEQTCSALLQLCRLVASEGSAGSASVWNGQSPPVADKRG